MTHTETALLSLSGVIALAGAAAFGRMPESRAKGMAAGIGAGLAVALVAGFLIGFLRNVLPFGQVDFWLASKLSAFWR